MRRIFASMAMAVMIAALPAVAAAVPAGQSLVKHKRTVSSVGVSAVDGANLYYISFRSSRGIRLLRASFLSSQRFTLAKFGRDGWFPVGLSAGGGRAVVSLVKWGFNERGSTYKKTKILSFPSDGAPPIVLAEGVVEDFSIAARSKSGHSLPRGDCGTMVEAAATSDDGVVVINQVTADRASVRCGSKPSVDHVRTFAIYPSGATAEVATSEVKINPVAEHPSAGGIQIFFEGLATAPVIHSVSAGRALYSRANGSKLWVRDLTSGALAGPYVLPPRWDLFGASLDDDGRVATNATIPTKRRGNQKRRSSTHLELASGLFEVPTLPQAISRRSKSKLYYYCGRRLIDFDLGGDLTERDPATFALRRTIVSAHDSSSLNGVLACNQHRLYLTGTGKKHEAITLVELD